jgi:8-amino-7-oxononanoate synthase
VRVAREDNERRVALQLRIAQFFHGAQQRGIGLMPSRTPIQPILVGDSAQALRVSRELEAAGYYVPAIRPPTVPAGQARLRVALSAAHDESMVVGLLHALQAAVQPISTATPTPLTAREES